MNPRWRAAPALISCMTIAAAALTIAISFGRPDVLALGLPFLLASAWMLATRPDSVPQVSTGVSSRTPTEGTAHEWWLQIQDAAGAEQLHLSISRDPYLRWADMPADLCEGVHGATVDLRRSWEAMRWGRMDIGGGALVLSSAWDGFRWGAVQLSGWTVRVLPAPTAFAVDATVPHPVGLVGRNRSARYGDGAEFADVRPFRAGDRLRHVHWPVSARTGELHVRTNYAEQDTQVTILLDASLDVGTSGGIHGSASCLDVALRTAASVSAQFLAVGERVALRVVGVPEDLAVPPGVGARQQLRILDTLSLVDPVGAPLSRRRIRMPSGTGLFLLISPLLSEVPMQVAALVAGRGTSVIVIDVLDAEQFLAETEGAHEQVAARLRIIERGQEIDAIRARGIPVTRWRGPGSLDVVLRQLARRPAPVGGRR